MNPLLLRYLPHILIALALIGGLAYVHQRAYNRGQASVQTKYDAYKAQIKAERHLERLAYDEALAEKVRVEEQLDQARWRIERELQPKLAVADAAGRSLARQLREYARERALREVTDSAALADGAFRDRGIDSEIDRTSEALAGSYKKDFLKQSGWRNWYDSIPCELKQEGC